MKHPNPTIEEILNNYFISNKCTITLKNGRILTGVFNEQDKPSGKIIGWFFTTHFDKKRINVPHDQIVLIEKPD